MGFRVFSTFTGIGGFEIGIANASPEPVEFVGYSEIDKYAVQVYEHNFKGVKNYGDITKIKAEKLPDFDCLVGGFPCQAFSVAGRRAGFADTRGTLFFDLARIMRAKRPRLFVFENVKGLLSHDGGKTFRVIVAAIDELGYDCQWQVLNSKNFGVPQNRERIIIVGHLRGTPRPQVFPIAGTDQKDPRIIGEDVAYALDASYHKGVGPDLSRARRSLVRVGTLRTHNDGKGFREMKSGVAPTIPARARNDGSGQPVIITGTPVYEDGKRRVKYQTSDQAPTIRATQYKSGDNQPKILQRSRGKNKGGEHDIAPTVTGKSYQDNNHVMQAPVQLTEARTEEAKRIRANSTKNGGREYAPRRGKVLVPRKDNIANTVTASQGKEGLLLSKTIRAGGRTSPPGSKQNWDTYEVDGVIRRLTPMECERLQAFPDNWTAEGTAGPISDTQRYKMCGNAVTTTVIEAVFQRILPVNSAIA